MPLGLSDVHLPADGTAPYSGAVLPGSRGLGTAPSATDAYATSPGTALDDRRDAPFTCDGTVYRLYQTYVERRARRYEVEVPPQDAIGILERAAAQHQRDPAFVRLLETAKSHLAGLHPHGTFVIVRLVLEPSAPVKRADSPPAERRSPLLPSPPERPLEVPAMSTAQAAALKTAAALGIPFCEECARLAAERAGADGGAAAV